MTKTERSKFRAHCKSEADIFDAQDTPVTRALRAQKIRQEKNLRTIRILIYITIAATIALSVKMFYEMVA